MATSLWHIQPEPGPHFQLLGLSIESSAPLLHSPWEVPQSWSYDDHRMMGAVQNSCAHVLTAIQQNSRPVLSVVGCSVTKLCLTLCDPMDRSMPGFPVLHHLPEFAQTKVHQVSGAIQSPHPLSSPSLALNLSQHQGLFQRVGSSHQVAKVLELQHQSFQCIFRIDFL